MVEDVGWIFKMLIPRGSGGFAVRCFVHGGKEITTWIFWRTQSAVLVCVCVCVYLAGENLLCPEMEVEKAPLIRPDGGYACTYGKSWGGGGDSVRMGLSRSNLFRHLWPIVKALYLKIVGDVTPFFHCPYKNWTRSFFRFTIVSLSETFFFIRSNFCNALDLSG